MCSAQAGGVIGIENAVHVSVTARHCLEPLQSLGRNVCCIEDESLLNTEIPDLAARISQYVSQHVQYASRYWSDHFCQSEIDEDVVNSLQRFCEGTFLHWVEVLSLMGELAIAIDSLYSARVALQVHIIAILAAWY